MSRRCHGGGGAGREGWALGPADTTALPPKAAAGRTQRQCLGSRRCVLGTCRARARPWARWGSLQAGGRPSCGLQGARRSGSGGEGGRGSLDRISCPGPQPWVVLSGSRSRFRVQVAMGSSRHSCWALCPVPSARFNPLRPHSSCEVTLSDHQRFPGEEPRRPREVACGWWGQWAQQPRPDLHLPAGQAPSLSAQNASLVPGLESEPGARGTWSLMLAGLCGRT